MNPFFVYLTALFQNISNHRLKSDRVTKQKVTGLYYSLRELFTRKLKNINYRSLIRFHIPHGKIFCSLEIECFDFINRCRFSFPPDSWSHLQNFCFAISFAMEKIKSRDELKFWRISAKLVKNFLCKQKFCCFFWRSHWFKLWRRNSSWVV